MDEITIVRRRTQIWPVVLMLILLALFVLAALWMLGYLTPANFDFTRLLDDVERRISGGTA